MSFIKSQIKDEPVEQIVKEKKPRAPKKTGKLKFDTSEPI